MTLRDAERLISKPRRWARLTDAELEELIKVASWISGVKDDDALDAAVGRLYEHVVETLPPDERRRITADLGEMLEEYARTNGTCPVGVLQNWLLRDPDFSVVSTAALAGAQLMDASDDDPLRGPRLVLELATETTDPDRQAAIVTGLAAMGDARVFTLIDRGWDALDRHAQAEILRHLGSHGPTVAAIEFLTSRLERAAEQDMEGPVGSVVASLVRMSRTATDVDSDYPFAGSGVRDVERIFPSWKAPAGTDVVTVRALYTVGEIGARFGPRLGRVAARETYPRLLPLALRAYESEDAPFVDAVRQAAGESGVVTGEFAILDEPVPIDPPADWERDDAVLEWGILNPYGPTKVQLCLVPVDENTRGLVYSLHNPFGPVCLLLGAARAGAGAAVRDMLLELAGRFQVGDHVLLKGLPHWVRTSAEPDHLTPADAASFFMALHQTALGRDLAIDGDIDQLTVELGRLRRDPQGEIRRQFTEAMELARATLAEAAAHRGEAALAGISRARGRLAPANGKAYERWFHAASAPGHVSGVSAHFLDCWNAALRFQRSSAGE